MLPHLNFKYDYTIKNDTFIFTRLFYNPFFCTIIYLRHGYKNFISLSNSLIQRNTPGSGHPSTTSLFPCLKLGSLSTHNRISPARSTEDEQIGLNVKLASRKLPVRNRVWFTATICFQITKPAPTSNPDGKIPPFDLYTFIRQPDRYSLRDCECTTPELIKAKRTTCPWFKRWITRVSTRWLVRAILCALLWPFKCQAAQLKTVRFDDISEALCGKFGCCIIEWRNVRCAPCTIAMWQG